MRTSPLRCRPKGPLGCRNGWSAAPILGPWDVAAGDTGTNTNSLEASPRRFAAVSGDPEWPPRPLAWA